MEKFNNLTEFLDELELRIIAREEAEAEARKADEETQARMLELLERVASTSGEKDEDGNPILVAGKIIPESSVEDVVSD